MRAVVTITAYVYGEDVQELYNEAKRIETSVKSLDDNHAKIESLTHAPFGSIDPMDHGEIDIDNMTITKEY